MSNLADMRTQIAVSNEDFLKVIFGDEWPDAHVTAFTDDPENITKERRALCWGGGKAEDRLSRFASGENQYFTISTFTPESGRAVRRKANFDACFVIVADDVGEKLPSDRVALLPEPTYKLFSSTSSEQWAWVLGTPCEQRGMVENLLDGLVTKGLAPSGRDPGMRGVTRYVRLPGGSNTKGKRCDEQGNPFKCYLSAWNPELMYRIEELADVFAIDLFKATGSGGGGEVVGFGGDEVVRRHPLMQHLHVTGTGADGWVRVDCPNVAEHSAEDPSGAAVRFLADGAVQYQCHHGACNGDAETEKLTGERVIKLLDKQLGGEGVVADAVAEYRRELDLAGTKALVEAGIAGVIPTPMEDSDYVDSGVFDPNDWVFTPNTNRYYQLSRGVDMCKDALNSLYLPQFPGGRGKLKAADQLNLTREEGVGVAEGFTWLPVPYGGHIERIVEHKGQRMINEWRGFDLTPMGLLEVGVQPWLDMLEFLVPEEEERGLVLGWLAFLLQYPHRKCQWHIIMRGEKGVGKDSLLAPVMRVLGESAGDITAEDLEDGWGDHFAKRKFVAMQEIYRPQDKKFTNTLKTLTASTGTGVHTYNLKGGRIIRQTDVLSVFAFSNHRYCMALEEGERRYLVLDCFQKRKSGAYYRKYYSWMENGGAAALFEFLLAVDTSNFCYWELPMVSEGCRDLIAGGKADYEDALEDMIVSQSGVFCIPHFETKHLKTELRERGHSPGLKGMTQILEKHGFRRHRGAKKVDGKTKNTPAFWTDKLGEKVSAGEAWDYYFNQGKGY